MSLTVEKSNSWSLTIDDLTSGVRLWPHFIPYGAEKSVGKDVGEMIDLTNDCEYGTVVLYL